MTRASDTARLLGAGATILDGTTISTADNTNQLTLISTDADANTGPNLVLQRDSASPADNDLAGTVKFIADNDAGEATDCVSMFSKIIDASDGTEDASLLVNSIVGGSQISRLGITPLEIVLNEDSADIDFRVESNGNAGMLYVDGGNDRVGIGTTAPDALLVINKAAADHTSAAVTIRNSQVGGYGSILNFESAQTNGSLITAATIGTEGAENYASTANTSSNLKFSVVGDGTLAEAMRITKNKNLAIGVTSEFARLHVASLGTSATPAMFEDTTTGTSSVTAVVLKRNGSNVGAINTTNNATAYVTSSDYRLKENVGYTFDATTRLKQLKPCRFNFITDADNTVDGFLAHEVSSIVPEAITGEKDETEDITNVVLNADGTIFSTNVSKEKWTAGKLSTTDEQGNTVDSIYASDTTWVASKTIPVMQSIDQSKLVPLLVKTIQELEARITTLENA